MSPHIIVLLSYLIIGIGLCHSAAFEKLRNARDTRNIPSNMFKPLNSGSNGNRNESAVTADEFTDDSFSEHSTGEAHVVTDPLAPTGRNYFPQQSSRDEEYDDRPSFRSNLPRYYKPSRFNDRFPSGIRTINFESTLNNGNIRGASGFGNPGFSDPEFGSLRPLRAQTIPLMATGIGPSLSPSGFPDNGLGQDSSSNFYRSESYSYSSDSNGPPQIERNVYDSRLGHGISGRKF